MVCTFEDGVQLLLLCEYGTLGGGERSMLATLGAVQSAGFTPTVVAPADGPLSKELRRREVEVQTFALRDAEANRLSQSQLREELGRLIRRRRPDLLHANSLAMGRLSGPIAAELGLPSISHLRDIIKLSSRAVADLNCHTRLLAVSEATRDFHVAGGLAAEKTHVLYNGVDLDRFRPRPASGYLHRQLDLPAGVPLIGTIGQICLRKGQDVLVQAAVALGNEWEDVHYLIVGERYSEKDESRRFEAELHAAAAGALAGRLHLLGYRHDVAEILNELTLLVHPARQEPLGRVLLEAAAAGVPVVATDAGGTAEIFPPASRSARLIPPDDPPALAAAVGELIGDQRQRRRLGEAARRRAEDAFEVNRAAAGLVRHYRDVVRDEKRGHH